MYHKGLRFDLFHMAGHHAIALDLSRGHALHAFLSSEKKQLQFLRETNSPFEEFLVKCGQASLHTWQIFLVV